MPQVSPLLQSDLYCRSIFYILKRAGCGAEEFIPPTRKLRSSQFIGTLVCACVAKKIRNDNHCQELEPGWTVTACNNKKTAIPAVLEIILQGSQSLRVLKLFHGGDDVSI